MIGHFPFVAVLCLTFAVNGDYVYNFRVTKLFVDLLSSMGDGYQHKVDGLSKIMKDFTKFEKAEQAFNFAISNAEGTSCAIPDNVLKLQTFKDKFDNSRKGCLSDPACANEVTPKVQVAIKTIQEIDGSIKADMDACGDEECKLKVFLTRDEKLAKLFQGTMPAVRSAADRVTGDAKCSTALLECLDNNNSQAVTEMISDSTNLQECVRKARPQTNLGAEYGRPER